MLGSRSAYTRARILDAAESLFAQKGHEATSLREITAVARVNLSSVHYHFGSKEGLIQAVFAQLVETLNRERLELLVSYEAAATELPLRLSPVLEAYFRPLIRFASRHSVIRQAFLPGREPLVGPEVSQHVMLGPESDVGLRFRSALAAAMPRMSMNEITWRMQVLLVAICCTLHYVDGLYLALRSFDKDLDELTTHQRLRDFLLVGVHGAFADQSPPTDNEALEPIGSGPTSR